jgi:hypothetical protein
MLFPQKSQRILEVLIRHAGRVGRSQQSCYNVDEHASFTRIAPSLIHTHKLTLNTISSLALIAAQVLVSEHTRYVCTGGMRTNEKQQT